MYEQSKMLNIEKYENVFSLNYIDFWDVKNICKYLHGHIELNPIKCNEKPILFYSRERYIGLEDGISSWSAELIFSWIGICWFGVVFIKYNKFGLWNWLLNLG